jgi:hypothetical protein
MALQLVPYVPTLLYVLRLMRDNSHVDVSLNLRLFSK